jgi:predicted dehydrogenase
VTRAAIVGAGMAAHLHAFALRSIDVDVARVYDPDPQRAETLAGMHDAVVVDSPDAAWDDGVDVVHLCSPPPLHVDQACAAAAAGRVVICEKPVAVDPDELDRLVAAATDAVIVPVVQWRAGQGFRTLRAAVADGVFGDRPSLGVALAWRREDAYFAAGRATRAQWGGGVLLSVGIHAVDALAAIVDRPVTAAVGTLGAPRADGDVESSASLSLAFDGGATATLRATFDAAASSTRITVDGAATTGVIDGGEADPTALPATFSGDHAEAATPIGDRFAATAAPLLLPFLDGVYRALADGDLAAVPTVADVAAAHRVIFDVYASGADS